MLLVGRSIVRLSFLKCFCLSCVVCLTRKKHTPKAFQVAELRLCKISVNNPDKPLILQVAVACPLPRLFDYQPPPGINPAQLQVGMRLWLPFGSRQRKTAEKPATPYQSLPGFDEASPNMSRKAEGVLGVLMGFCQHSDVPTTHLKAVYEVLDTAPLLTPDVLKLLRWAASYYHYPIGRVLQAALPALLNQGLAAQLPMLPGWQLTQAGRELNVDTLNKRAYRQRALLEFLHQCTDFSASQAALNQHYPNSHSTLKTLQKHGWLENCRIDKAYSHCLAADWQQETPLPLNEAQTQAVQAVSEHLSEFRAFLLDGVTGSGKTEVYLQIIQKVIEQGKQALVLVPEINLTPQMLTRFERRFAHPIAVLHSKLTDNERLSAWLMAQRGNAPIVIGTRSAAWTPLAKPGVFIVDEEHDASYKQQDGFQYSARDLTVMRARYAGVPVLLGSATPALDSLFNAQRQRYHCLRLPERAGAALHPDFRLIDLRRHQPQEGLSQPLRRAIQIRLDLAQQVLIYINRRGFAPTLMCHQCGWVATCHHCTAHLTYHDNDKRLHCHHCGATQSFPAVCPACQSSRLRRLGYGTERIEQELTKQFPQARILRIDSDSTRRKYAMQHILEQIHEGEVDILVGTQMLTKGHHFPKVTLVGVVNLDGGLFGVDFRASERLAQGLMQVAGRAGRADLHGEVLLQTYHPHHPLLRALLERGYGAFADTALAEREQVCLPPYSYLALLRAEATQEADLNAFLQQAKARAEAQMMQQALSEVEVLGPIPAPLERRANFYRAQLLCQAQQRAHLHALLSDWTLTLSQLPTAKGVKWSLDIDPQNLF